jgi:hypothetical protein
MRVILSGGLGNQLFKFMAAQKYIDLDTSKKLIMDTSWFGDENHKNRSSHIFFQLQSLCDNDLYFVKKTRFPKFHQFLLRKINRLNRSTLNKLRIFRYHEESHGVTFSPRLVIGDFENYKCLPKFETVNTILNKLDSRSEWKRELTVRIKQEDPIIMHVRLGDYVNYPEIYGFLDSDYYVQALRTLRSKGVSGPLWLTSDNPNAAMSKLSGKIDIDFVLIAPIEIEPLQVMLSIAESRNLIMAHSTFSWWSAWISFHRNHATNIVMPSRFLSHELDAKRLQVPGWHVVEI